jgi:hypothetical protein
MIPAAPVTEPILLAVSNSFGLKYAGGGGVGAITSWEGTTGSPANATTVCDAMAATAKANLFIPDGSILN